MERQRVEKVLRTNESDVRFAAKGSLNEIKKAKKNSFGGKVITHASRPEVPPNIYNQNETKESQIKSKANIDVPKWSQNRQTGVKMQARFGVRII